MSKGDSRVTGAGDQDATMVDVGEKDRPPGEPPDASTSWVEKVVGKNAGGMLRPEEVIDEEFVTERLCLEFPDGEDGEPVITIGKEMLEVMNGLWKKCMIVKVLGHNISLPVLSRKLREMWKPSGDMFVMDLPRQFFMIRFELEEEYLTALTGGPWKAFGSYLMAQAWSPDFDPLKDEIVTTPVWVRLSNIPVNFYHKTILLGIAKGLGNPVKVDLTTLQFERARFARVCVEVNLKKPLKGTVMINGERYFVSYEGLTNICSHCGLYGHLVHSCPKRAQEKAVVVAPPTVAVTPSGPEVNQVDDGFTMVRSAGRRVDMPMKKAAVSAGGSRVESGTTRRDPVRRKNTGNIPVSNRFGSLGSDMAIPVLQKEGVIFGENKENEVLSNQAFKGKSVSQESAGSLGYELSRDKGGPRTGLKERSTWPNKPADVNGLKPKQAKINRPMRGLVFGPTKGELNFS